MNDNGYKATGCLWVFMELICMGLFVILFITKLCGSRLLWITVFAPLIVGMAISVIVLLVVVALGVGDKDGKFDSKQ